MPQNLNNWRKTLFRDVFCEDRDLKKYGKFPKDYNSSVDAALNRYLTEEEKTVILCVYKDNASLAVAGALINKSSSAVMHIRDKALSKLRKDSDARNYFIYGKAFAEGQIAQGCLLRSESAPLEDLILSSQTYTCLKSAGYLKIMPVFHDVYTGKLDYTKIPDMDVVCLNELKQKLALWLIPEGSHSFDDICNSCDKSHITTRTALRSQVLYGKTSIWNYYIH